ncbi:MAG: hypothetical protein GY698_22415, partial [Actinomycetia bacterium]|nr:hypothetical protein [Actinomycetes bacterium]
RDDPQTEPVEPGDTDRPTEDMVDCSLALTADHLDMADTIREAPRKRLAAAVRAAKRDDGDGAEHTDRAALRAALRGTPEIMSGMAKKRSARERRR